MATLTNTIKRANKATNSKPQKSGQFYTYNYKGYELSFAQNGSSDEATCFYTKRANLKDDITTDYFAGTFHDNVSQAIKFIDYMTRN
jgi:hypothetical protein